jgi:hypothetical protein
MSILQVRRADAKRTIEKLIHVHQQTIADIDGGKNFYRGGDNVSDKIRARCEFEIRQCRIVYEALDSMKEGDIKRASDLCAQIQENIFGNVIH